jgi:DNA polymerase (family 10)
VTLRNGEIADLFDLLGDLYELDGVNMVRVQAYHRAATQMRQTAESVWQLSEQGRLQELPGIGATIAAKVDELRASGTMTALEKLRAKRPESLVEIKRLPGVGTKLTRRLYDELGVSSLAELKEAAEAGKLRDMKGLGEKSEARILEHIAAGAAPRKTVILLERALELATTALGPLREHPACVRASEAGSLRRRVESVGDIDLIAASDEPGVLTAWFAEQPWVGEVVGKGESKASVISGDGIQVDLRVVPPEVYGNLLQHFTGSKSHNVAMREDAVRRGLKISEYGVEDVETGEVTRCLDEDEVYRRLGYQPIPPELREGGPELRVARENGLPELIAYGSLRGDLHSHSDASDGKAPLEQMVEAARAAGLEYLAVTDHSAGVGLGIGIEADELLRSVERIRELAAELDDIVLLAGAEVDVMADGELYYRDDVLEQLDWVVASMHQGQRGDRDRIMKRMLAALEHPLVDVLGHPTGRLIGRREGMDVDVGQMTEAAARHGTWLEINSQPHRLDLRPAHARRAIDAGVTLVISTDAHRPDSFPRLDLGVAMARRAWATAADVANTRSWAELQALRKPGRRVAVTA